MQSNRKIAKSQNRKISWRWTPRGFVPCDSVPVADRGFRYGMSVFESLPIRKKIPIFLRQHLERLRRSIAQAGFKTNLPTHAEIENILRETAFDGFARIYVTAGDGPVTGAFENGRVFVFVESRKPSPSRVYHRGYDLGIAPEPHRPLLGGLKTGNRWANLDAFRRGVARQKNETLLFNSRGELISACMANVFVVHNGKIKTPSPDCGARDGVVREWVERRRAVEQCRLFADDLQNADEIFLTSSWLGIMPAASLDARRLPSRAVAETLRVEYENETGVHPTRRNFSSSRRKAGQ